MIDKLAIVKALGLGHGPSCACERMLADALSDEAAIILAELIRNKARSTSNDVARALGGGPADPDQLFDDLFKRGMQRPARGASNPDDVLSRLFGDLHGEKTNSLAAFLRALESAAAAPHTPIKMSVETAFDPTAIEKVMAVLGEIIIGAGHVPGKGIEPQALSDGLNERGFVTRVERGAVVIIKIPDDAKKPGRGGRRTN